MRLTHVAIGRDDGAAGPEWLALGSVPVADGVVRSAGLELELTRTSLGSGLRVDAMVRNPTSRDFAVGSVRFKIECKPEVVLEHGYQSWSPVSRRSPGRTRPWRRRAPSWTKAVWHARPDLAGRAVTGDQFLVIGSNRQFSADNGVVGFLDAKRHLSTVVARPDGVWAAAWLDGVALPPGSSRPLDPLWIASGDPGRLYSELAGLWADEASARRNAASPLGWCSWYQYFSEVTPEDIRRNLSLANQHGMALVQVDDGYQRAVGDWLTPRPSWSEDGDGFGQIAAVADEIRAAGLLPGIWTAPFLVSPKSEVARRFPEWVATDDRGRPLRAMWNPRSWGGWVYALDTTRPAVLEHLTTTFHRLAEMGFDYHKIDFCYAATMPGRRLGDGTQTRAEALRAGLVAVREGIGPTRQLLGCGCPLGPAVGIVDAMRVSPDTAPRWGPGVVQVPGYPDTAPSARNAVRASVLRAPLHRRLWVNDPDCLVIRPVKTHLSESHRAILASVVAGTGGFTLLSDDLALYGDAEWNAVARLAATHSLADRPLSIEDPFAEEVRVTSDLAQLRVRWTGKNPRALWTTSGGT